MSKPRRMKFSTSLEFSPYPPYRDLFAERVPLLQALSVAIANFGWLRHSAGLSRSDRLRNRLFGRRFNAAECGVFNGSSLVASATLMRGSGLDFRIDALDTFEGLPGLSETDKSLAPPDAVYRDKTLFTETSIETVNAKLELQDLHKHVQFHKGMFKDTLPGLEDRQYHFVNIDCDLYEPHIECLEYFYPRMHRGAVIFFDDYTSPTYPMAGAAVNKFLQGKPEKLVRLKYGADIPNGEKAFLVKF